MSDAVNTGFILDMQRKLYRWSAADPEKRSSPTCSTWCVTAERWLTLGNGWPVTGGATRRARIG